MVEAGPEEWRRNRCNWSFVSNCHQLSPDSMPFFSSSSSSSSFPPFCIIIILLSFFFLFFFFFFFFRFFSNLCWKLRVSSSCKNRRENGKNVWPTPSMGRSGQNIIYLYIDVYFLFKSKLYWYEFILSWQSCQRRFSSGAIDHGELRGGVARWRRRRCHYNRTTSEKN